MRTAAAQDEEAKKDAYDAMVELDRTRQKVTELEAAEAKRQADEAKRKPTLLSRLGVGGKSKKAPKETAPPEELTAARAKLALLERELPKRQATAEEMASAKQVTATITFSLARVP